MKILSNYDRVITEALAEKVTGRMSFKVRQAIYSWIPQRFHHADDDAPQKRAISIRIGSAMKSGHS